MMDVAGDNWLNKAVMETTRGTSLCSEVDQRKVEKNIYKKQVQKEIYMKYFFNIIKIIYKC